jgi:hypothetical protein
MLLLVDWARAPKRVETLWSRHDATQTCWHALGSRTHTHLRLAQVAAKDKPAPKLNIEANTAKGNRRVLTFLLTECGTRALDTKASAHRSTAHACGSTHSHHTDTATHQTATITNCIIQGTNVEHEDDKAQTAAYTAVKARLNNMSPVLQAHGVQKEAVALANL